MHWHGAPGRPSKSGSFMEAVLETVAIAFVATGVVWFVAVHIAAVVKAIREKKGRRGD